MRNIYNDIRQIKHAANKKAHAVPKTEKSPKSHFFTALSRDNYYESRRNKDKIPPWGYYNVDYKNLDNELSTPKLSALWKAKSPRLNTNPGVGAYELNTLKRHISVPEFSSYSSHASAVIP